MLTQLAKYTLLILITTLFNSCEYVPLGVYEGEVDENIDPPEIEIVELNINDDPLIISSDYRVIFKFKCSAQFIAGMEIVFDGESCYADDLNSIWMHYYNGHYDIDYESLSGGLHTLDLKVFTLTGTGSIAEYFGSEFFVTIYSFRIIAN